MLAANSIMKPQDGKPVISPNQDMVIGCHYLTLKDEKALGAGRVFASMAEAEMAYHEQEISLHAPIRVRLTRTFDGVTERRLIDCTLGLLIFNSVIPQDLGLQPRASMDDMFLLEVDHEVNKKDLGRIVDNCYHVHGVNITAKVLDDIKRLGYTYSTKGAITVSISDIVVPPEKQELLTKADEQVENIEKRYRRGLMSEDERYKSIIDIWSNTTNDLKGRVIGVLDKNNPIYMMTNSGARSSIGQVSQLAGMPRADGLALRQDQSCPSVPLPRRLKRAGVLHVLPRQP